jgi:hypothetical protein
MIQADAKRFHDDLRAAVVARVPLDIGDQKSELLTLDQIDRLEDQILPQLSADPSTDDQTRQPKFDTLPEVGSRYQAALQVFDRLGTMTPVLDGLTTRILAERRVARTLRWTIIYLLLLLLVAFVGLSLFLVRVVPTFDNMRADLLLPAAINAPPRLDLIQWMPGIVVALGVCFVLLLSWFLFGGASKVAMWLGGRHFVRCQTSKTTLRTIRALLDSGLSWQEAVSISCDLTGADAASRQDIQSMVQTPTTALQLDTLQNYLTISANQRLASMKIATPIALITTFGGAIGLLYCVSIFWPIIAMVKDLATAGT